MLQAMNDKILKIWLGLFLLLTISAAIKAQPGPPYSVTWVNQIGVSTNGVIITRTATTGTWSASGAVSANLLQSNTDGWMEFTAVAGNDYLIGLAENNIINYNQFTHSIRLTGNSNALAAYEGGSGIALGNFQTGDIIRIWREGSNVKYYKNGIVLRTVAVNPTADLKVKASLPGVGYSTPNITTSFDSRLLVHGTVTGADGDTGSGSILLSVSGGTAPYAYNWSSGEQTSSIENKPRGSYTVTVTDALGRALTRSYGIGYKINWLNQVGVSNNDGRLTKTEQTAGWNSGAISSNLLLANTDGWIEVVGVSDYNFIIGLSTNDPFPPSSFANSLFFDNATGRAVVYEGIVATSLGIFQTGDVFRISREGAVVKYYRNGIVLRTVSVSPSLELEIKAALTGVGYSTPKITSSFDCQLRVLGNVTGADGASGSGSIALSVTGGASPYTYSWSSGEQTSSIANKSRGSYTVTVTDALGRILTRTYGIGYKVNWIDQVGVSNNDGRLTKTSQAAGWNSGAISSNLLPANTDGWIELAGMNNSDFIIGLAVNNYLSNSRFANSIFFDWGTARAVVYEGAAPTSLGIFQTGDVFRISREGGSVKYYRNGTVVRTIAVSASLELKVKAALSIPGTSTTKINSSFDGQLVVYANVIGLEGNSGSGSITLNVSGGTEPYTYSWSSGEQTGSLTNKARGTYTVTVNDAIGRTTTRTYNIGYKSNWINLTGVTNNNGRLTKTATDVTWASGAVSSNVLPPNTNGWIEFVGINGHLLSLGLASNDIMNYTQFTNSFLIDNESASVAVYEGSSGFYLGNLQTGDVFKISREGSLVKYYRNDVVLRTISVSPSLALKVKACLKYAGTGTPYVNTSFWASDGVVRTYYTIADGNWTTPSVWSLNENGPPSTVYPDDIDKVVVKGHEVTVNSNVKTSGVTITATNDNTKLKVDGATGVLTVKGNIVMNRENPTNTAEVLVVQNNGKLDVR